jgi:serine/threonine protein kinase/DNA-binding winged helix-turn-helix (wHTH) protein/tetratricopeptide (TPR) repeat protein
MAEDFEGRVRLGGFELDLHSGELCPMEAGDNRQKILLREQPFQLLRMLIASEGKIVTREAIRKQLWPNDTIVDFDHSINVAIRILRRALGDSADNPKYIETLARRGYRLRTPVEWLPATVGAIRPRVAVPRPSLGLAGLVGRKVSHYRVLEVIGCGGMGMVYQAEDLKLGRRVALKFLPDESAADSLALRRFEREAQSASALNHPNICTIHGIEAHEGRPFIVMELLEGESLRERLNATEGHRLPLPLLLEVATQISDGLQAAHDKGIIHRDIKPANIFLTKQGVAKILDFGLAKPAALEGRGEANSEIPPVASTAQPNPVSAEEGASEQATLDLTNTGAAIGTAGYMSPEQIRKEALDARTDLFSFGLVLFEMATGKPAFFGETEAALHDAILHQPTPSVRGLNPSAPRALDGATAKALEKDQARRYQSASDMRSDLERVRRDMNPGRRHVRRFLFYAALSLVASSAALIYWNYRNRVTLSPRDTLVLADFSNHPSDAVLGQALTTALHVGMEQTPYLNVLGPDKIIGNLLQLGLPPDAKVTPETARQICLRTNSKMIVTSTVADAGNGFEIELAATGCQNGETFLRVRQNARLRAGVVHALGVAAVQLRRKLGERSASIAQYNQPIEVAASSSPEALQLLAEGNKHLIVRDLQTAESLYQQAIDVDPNFALAYLGLGAALQTALQSDLAVTAEKKAYALRNRLTVPGRFQAETGYYDIATGELDKSAAIYARWLELFPQNLIAQFNYSYCLLRLGRGDESAVYARDVARNLPSSPIYDNLMEAYIDAGRLEEAGIAFDEALAHQIDDPALRSRRALLAFLERDNAALEEQWSWAAQHPPAEIVMQGKALMLIYYGQFHVGRRLLEETMAKKKVNAPGEDFTNGYALLASQEAAAGNFEQARQAATNALAGPQGRFSDLNLALTFALTGDSAQAQKLANSINQKVPLDTLVQNYSLPAIRAAMQLRANRPADAIETLRPALKYDMADPAEFNSLYPAYLRGLAYLQMNDGRHAAAEFQKLLDHPGLVGRDVVGALVLLQMGRALKISGNDVAAGQYYERFLNLWKGADPDIPIYRKAKTEEAQLTSLH